MVCMVGSFGVEALFMRLTLRRLPTHAAPLPPDDNTSNSVVAQLLFLESQASPALAAPGSGLGTCTHAAATRAIVFMALRV